MACSLASYTLIDPVLCSLFSCPCYIWFGQGDEQKSDGVVHDYVFSLGA